MLCEALGGIGGLEPRALEAYMSDILHKIKQLSTSDVHAQTSTKVLTIKILFFRFFRMKM